MILAPLLEVAGLGDNYNPLIIKLPLFIYKRNFLWPLYSISGLIKI